ncbi:MAG: electron transfer flavoprotein subunit beta/FixA family protein [Chloroflexi bacterium]|jgi:electron transfer flavoprotein beta subunit|nr:electron transfer flavoprotein subunit beta/FixA family protein [Chloroflexota bacterium]MBT7081609.1 electron transfer flavoprotein subunit beta/FixA family protein [Chloroflexota bacterium]MBT7290008.1 electron transfer flavoprotein subunit beta/FixA family protein [Chloroflexota bacterium]
MNIAVCIKQVPDTEGHIDVDRRSGSITSPNLVINPLDVLAVEEAVRIKGQLVDVRVTVVCMGPDIAERALRGALSMGADEAVHVWDEQLVGSDSYVAGRVLATAIGPEQYDLILCGQMAADTQAGQVGAVIAEILEIPLITAVVSIDLNLQSGRMEMQRKVDGGKREVVQTSLPAVLTVESGINKPRYPTLRAIKDAEKKQIEKLNLKALDMSPNEVGATGSLIKVVSVSVAKPSIKNLFVPDSNLLAIDRINILMSGGISDKKAEMILGGLQEAASYFVQFVKERKLL